MTSSTVGMVTAPTDRGRWAAGGKSDHCPLRPNNHVNSEGRRYPRYPLHQEDLMNRTFPVMGFVACPARWLWATLQRRQLLLNRQQPLRRQHVRGEAFQRVERLIADPRRQAHRHDVLAGILDQDRLRLLIRHQLA